MKTTEENPSLYHYTLIFSICLVVIEVVGGLWYSPIAWGINLFHFLPIPYLILFVLLSIGGIYLSRTGKLDNLIKSGSLTMEKKPFFFLGVTIAIFIAIAYLLRIEVPLLGDSFLLVNNYVHTFDGSHDLNITREPLALLYFYWMMNALGTTVYPAVKNAFLAGELLLGAAVIVMGYYLARELFDAAEKRFLFFLFLLLLPSMQLFFGYVEIYSVVVFSLMPFLLAAVLYHKKKASFIFVCLSYYLLLATHIIAIVISPALLYLGYLEWKQNGVGKILLAITSGVLFIGAVYLMLDGHTDRVFPDEPYAHYLWFFPVNDGSQAFTLFSPYHFLELGNLLLLSAPFGLFFAGIFIIRERRLFIANPMNIFFTLATIFFLGFLFVAKFDLGTAKDWDVTAPWLLMVQLYLAYLLLQYSGKGAVKIFTLILPMLLLHSAHWFILNASVDPPIARAESLFDDRIDSRNASFNGTLHLSKYYYLNGDLETTVILWKKFNAIYPDFPTGYENLIVACMATHGKYDSLADESFHKWMEADPSNASVREKYIGFCITAADRQTAANNPRGAGGYYLKAVIADTTSVKAFNYLGKFYALNNQIDEAISCFAKTVSLEPKYFGGFMNLGVLYSRKGDYQNAVQNYRQVIALDSTRGEAYDSLAGLLSRNHEKEKAAEILRLKEKKAVTK
ncbi:MAG: tetratricopeptide repeat protein [Bacteroidota bacterium]